MSFVSNRCEDFVILVPSSSQFHYRPGGPATSTGHASSELPRHTSDRLPERLEYARIWRPRIRAHSGTCNKRDWPGDGPERACMPDRRLSLHGKSTPTENRSSHPSRSIWKQFVPALQVSVPSRTAS